MKSKFDILDEIMFAVRPDGTMRYHCPAFGEILPRQRVALYTIAKLIVGVLFGLNLDELLPLEKRNEPWVS